jgi:hypothetical protein
MDFDYPAAHSMDTAFYAVDKDGHVALFSTGAGGAVPTDAYLPDDGDVWAEISQEVREALGFPAGEDLYHVELPAGNGLFVYETGPFDECLVDRYERKRKPRRPLHLDQLPPDVRQAVAGMRFATLDFNKTKVFQPVELTECSTWDPAYLTGDGKTVKPVPGREEEYAEFIEEGRDVFEEEGLTVEEPEADSEAAED